MLFLPTSIPCFWSLRCIALYPIHCPLSPNCFCIPLTAATARCSVSGIRRRNFSLLTIRFNVLREMTMAWLDARQCSISLYVKPSWKYDSMTCSRVAPSCALTGHESARTTQRKYNAYKNNVVYMSVIYRPVHFIHICTPTWLICTPTCELYLLLRMTYKYNYVCDISTTTYDIYVLLRLTYI